MIPEAEDVRRCSIRDGGGLGGSFTGFECVRLGELEAER